MAGYMMMTGQPIVQAKPVMKIAESFHKLFHPGEGIDRDYRHNEAILANDRDIYKMQNAEKWKYQQYADMGINPMLAMGSGAAMSSGSAQADGTGESSNDVLEAVGTMANMYNNAKAMTLKERQLDLQDKEVTAKILSFMAKKMK